MTGQPRAHFVDALARLAGALSALCLAAMVLVLGATLVGRPFGVLVPSSEEIVTFLMVGMAFFGIVYAYVEGAHVRVDTLHRRLPARLRHGLEIVSHVGAAALCATIAYQAGRLTWTAYRFHDLSDGLIPIPMWIPLLTVPLGFGLFALMLLRDAGRIVAGRELRFGIGEKDEAVALASAATRGDIE